ncbi:hypothetical protein BS17DRAFT_791811 [Gyrodon lividus]|nr:hypothetical protein BS17DRAFT_791811 [Gyrodon lividus]
MLYTPAPFRRPASSSFLSSSIADTLFRSFASNATGINTVVISNLQALPDHSLHQRHRIFLIAHT